MNLESFVGKKTGTYSETLKPEDVKAFCEAVGIPFNQEKIPPTYLTTLRTGEFDLLKEIGVPLPQILHGEQEYTYEKEIRPGSAIQFETEFTQVTKKEGKNGVMSFLIFTSKISSNGSLSATSKTTVVARGVG
ncbi:MaoC family dehydratase N-terminal domain-containing protein [bacterium]|jgi:hypothetical protein|nr:MaoC family dehydratase N-terminal domain-containing protein [bacterium]